MDKGSEISGVSPGKLMQDVVKLIGDRWVQPERFITMLDQYAISAISSKVRFLAGLRDIIKTIPISIFESLEARNELVQKLQDALDMVIAEEEGIED